jgi:hopanoid biosynthesis associated RND transporter like protein HpnN
MIQKYLVPLVGFCHRRAVLVALAALVLTALAGYYAANNISMDTDEARLLSDKLPWRQQEMVMDKAFPGLTDQLVIVVDGGTPDQSEDATRKLTEALQKDTTHFRGVHRPDGGPFFVKEGVLLLPQDDLRALLDKTVEAQPLLGQLVADPSPRGLFDALSMVARGVAMGATQLNGIDPALREIDKSIQSVLEGHMQPLSWQSLLSGQVPGAMAEHVILVQPKLDYTAMQPGGEATDAVRAVAKQLGFNHGPKETNVRMRITGEVALSDEEIASAAQGALVAAIGSLIVVIVWLVLALRSLRLILAILGTLVTGFALTGAFAALAVGSLNMISVAFAVLFIGLATDFSIQFSVRYRDERYRSDTLGAALENTALHIGGPIAVAAFACAAGFYSFLPTDFRGVSELGLIAGSGMLIAFACNMTVLPALLTLVRPRAESEPVGYKAAAPADRFLDRARWPVVGLAALVGIAGLVMLPRLHFDFDALHVKDQHSESVSTLNDLMNDPLTTPYSAEILTPSPQDAAKRAAEMEKLPQVRMAVSINSFVPSDQKEKLAMIDDAATVLLPTLNPPQVAPAPTADEVRASIKSCREAMQEALQQSGKDPIASAFVTDMQTLETANDDVIAQLTPALISSLPQRIDDLRQLLNAAPVTLDTLPDDIKSDWVTPDGRARVEIYPKGDARHNDVLQAFDDAIMKAAPDATGSAISIRHSSQTIINSFIIAGASAIVVIAILLFVALRRLTDVLLVLFPLLLAGLMTVIVCVAWPFPLNFANIIALPLLLGIGVAFDIYFVMNWRAGQTKPLQSPTARAILFSALTTGTAFGSLSLSHHPGTASMGILLIISLVFTLICTLIVLPSMLAMMKHKVDSDA